MLLHFRVFIIHHTPYISNIHTGIILSSSFLIVLSVYVIKKFSCFNCIPRQKSGILRIQYGHAATSEIPFWMRQLKNILVRTFKFGMWVYMGNGTNTIVLGGLHVTNPPIRLMFPTSVCPSTFFVSGLSKTVCPIEFKLDREIDHLHS